MKWHVFLAGLCGVVFLSLAGGAAAHSSNGSTPRLPLSVNLQLHPGSKQTIVTRLAAVTAPSAKCSAMVAVRRQSQQLPLLHADRRGRAAWQWLILATSPSGTWNFRVTCEKGRARQTRVKTASIITPASGGNGPLGGLNSLTTSGGRIAGLGSDGNPFSAGQCTWMAWEKRRDIYHDAVNAGIPAAGSRGVSQGVTVWWWDGMMWYRNAQKAGLNVGITPQQNALVSWNDYSGNPYGHVAWVKQVDSDTHILVTQCNGFTGACGDKWINPKTYLPGGLEGYIYGGKAAQPTPAPTPTPTFNPAAYNGHIVKQDNGNVTAWLVTDGHRNWIPDQSTYNCLKSQGHPGPDLLNATQLNQLPDQNGLWASCSASPSPPTKDTTPPSVPTGFGQIDNSQTAVRVAWSASSDNVGVAGYDLYLNGSLAVTGATSSYVLGGLSCGTSYSLGVDAYDSAGNHSAQATSTGTTQACPVAPPPSVTVSRGAPRTVSGCTSSACAYIVVTLSNFGPGSHTVGCYADDPYPYDVVDPFYTYTTSSTTSAVCVYGYPGYHVWAKVDGVSSGQVTW